jgi:hypothetical protein
MSRLMMLLVVASLFACCLAIPLGAATREWSPWRVHGERALWLEERTRCNPDLGNSERMFYDIGFRNNGERRVEFDAWLLQAGNENNRTSLGRISLRPGGSDSTWAYLAPGGRCVSVQIAAGNAKYY